MNQLEKSKVEAHWQREREKMNESLDEYVNMCARFKVSLHFPGFSPPQFFFSPITLLPHGQGLLYSF